MSSPHEHKEKEKTAPEDSVERDSESEEEEEETDPEDSVERDPEEDLINFLIGLGIILVVGLYNYICGGIYISPRNSSLISSSL